MSQPHHREQSAGFSGTRTGNCRYRGVQADCYFPAMTYPRAHLIDAKNGGYYHLTSRCVRRAWLCGLDPQTHQNYEHRRRWLEQRIAKLSALFAVDLYAYAVMSNHYHIVLNSNPARTQTWSREEVARRWVQCNSPETPERERLLVDTLLDSPIQLKRARERLGSISWFMRFINEPLARRANAEDDCKGRFWEGRFKSVALLDQSALLNCMVYVDLNPSRATPNSPVPAQYTSAWARTHSSRSKLQPLEPLGFKLPDYLALLEEARLTTKQAGATHPVLNTVAERLGFSAAQWRSAVQVHHERYRAYGNPASVAQYVSRIGQSWLQVPGLRLIWQQLERPAH